MNNASKLVVRLTIFYTALYFLSTYASAIFDGEIYFNDFYIVLLELCLCIFVFVQGKYHCKYARFTALGVFVSDSITRLDGAYDFIPIGYAAEIPATILAMSVLVSFVLAIRHFIKVKKLKRQRNEIH